MRYSERMFYFLNEGMLLEKKKPPKMKTHLYGQSKVYESLPETAFPIEHQFETFRR